MSTIALITVATLVMSVSGQERPEWAAEVPDTVWLLVERSAAVPDEETQRELLREAERHARASLAGHENEIGRRFGLAVVLGLRASREGGQTKVRAAADLSSVLEGILAIDPEHSGARHMLGRLHAGVRRMNRVTRWVATNLLGGDELKRATWEAAEEHLAFAEDRAPEVSDHHLQLALLYRDTGRPELARTEVAHVLALEAESPMELSVRDEARRVWSELAQ
jgi:hypothetical protein